MSGWADAAVAGLFGGVLAVERRAFLQAMFSRPLVASTLMGALLDDVPSGLFVGMVLELFHLGSANLGASLPENDTLAATGTASAAAAIAAGSQMSSPATWAAALLLFGWVGSLGRLLDRHLARYSTRLARKAQVSADAGELTRAVRQNLWGMWPHFVLFGATTVGCYGVGKLLGPWFPLLPDRAIRALAWSYPAIASVSAAIAARGSHARRAALYAGGAAALVVLGALALLVWGAE